MKKNFKQKAHKTNYEIKTNKVRLVGNGQPIVLDTKEAIKMAFSEEKDLILISESGDIPVVRIEDYNKFIYDKEKKEKELAKKAHKSELKEIQLSCHIAENDLNTKARKAKEFLEHGDKVKCVIDIRGRQKAMPEQGELVMLKFASLLEPSGIPETFPKFEGNKWLMTMKPKSKK